MTVRIKVALQNLNRFNANSANWSNSLKMNFIKSKANAI